MPGLRPGRRTGVTARSGVVLFRSASSCWTRGSSGNAFAASDGTFSPDPSEREVARARNAHALHAAFDHREPDDAFLDVLFRYVHEHGAVAGFAELRFERGARGPRRRRSSGPGRGAGRPSARPPSCRAPCCPRRGFPRRRKRGASVSDGTCSGPCAVAKGEHSARSMNPVARSAGRNRAGFSPSCTRCFPGCHKREKNRPRSWPNPGRRTSGRRVPAPDPGIAHVAISRPACPAGHTGRSTCSACRWPG